VKAPASISFVSAVRNPADGVARRLRLDRARLYLVLDAEPHGRPAEAVLEPALRGGVDVVQLREKNAPDAAVVAAGLRFRALCHDHDALFVVNDRADLAVACGADGVHVGQDDATVTSARAVVGDDLLVGVSTHSPDQIARAREQGADLIGVGPVFPTATKPSVAAVGEGLVRHAAARAGLPFFAIGGIDGENVGSVVAAGASRVAVVRAIRDAPDPEAAAVALRTAVGLEVPVGTAR
jgi:thiamine-phosphate pyrophosphorylase